MINDRIWILLTRKLSGEATLTELEELASLVSRYPEAEKDIETVAAWWGSSVNADTDFLEATYLIHLERMKTKGFKLSDDEIVLEEKGEEMQVTERRSKIRFSLRTILTAVIIIFLMAGSWALVSQFQNSPSIASVAKPAEILTRNGARSKILLPDGTNVWLNSGSKIIYNKDFETAGIREVYLTGEAFFDVVKMPKRPFIVHTAKIDIKVLGTRFNVKAYEEDKTTETSLIKGSVEVFLKRTPLEKYLLKPDQKLVLLNDEAIEKSGNNPKKPAGQVVKLIEIKPLTYLEGTETDIESSWTKNILSFEDEPFAEVAKKMERWYDVSFEFKNKRWEQEFLSGSFEKESLEQAMKALKYSTGFEYETEGKNIFIY